MFNACLLPRRGSRLAAVALTSVALLTACETDNSVGPNAGLPTSASLAKLSGPNSSATLVIRMVDQNNNVIPALAAWAKFTVELKGQSPMDVIDNGKRDADLTVGIVRVSGLAAGTYTVCQTVAPTNRVLPPNPCATIALVAGRIGSIDFVNLAKARIRWSTKDYVGNLIGGMEFSFQHPDGTFVPFSDNLIPDLDPTDGKVELQVDTEGFYTVCEVGLPAGYVPPQQQMVFCFTKELKHGQITDAASWVVYPQFSMYWGVSNGVMDSTFNLIPIGGASFTVSSSLGTMTVVDNGANDIDQRPGQIAVKLAGESYYTICQTVVPAGYSAPTNPCKRIQLYEGDPTFAGWFINPKILPGA